MSDLKSIEKGIGPHCEKMLSKVFAFLKSGDDFEKAITRLNLDGATIENLILYLWTSMSSRERSEITFPRKYLRKLINELFIAGLSIDSISSELRISKSLIFSNISLEAKKIRLLHLYEEKELTYSEMSRVLGIKTSTLEKLASSSKT